MKQRLITAGVLLCILAPVLLTSGTFIFPIVAAFFCVAAVFEMLRCLGTHKNLAIAIPSYCIAIGLPLGLWPYCGLAEGISIQPLNINRAILYLLLIFGITVFYFFLMIAAAVFGRRSYSFTDVTSSFAMVFYITLAFVAIPLVRFGTGGEYYYLLCFLGPWITDSFAYFTGYFFGRHKLIPEISPKKTVEGAVGGVVSCAAFYVLFGVVVANVSGHTPSLIALAVLGVVVSIVSQLGDLIASLIKRDRDVKDYSNIFPGHGGVMDRFDSIIAAAPILLIACTVDSYLGLNLLL